MLDAQLSGPTVTWSTRAFSAPGVCARNPVAGHPVSVVIAVEGTTEKTAALVSSTGSEGRSCWCAPGHARATSGGFLG